MTNLDTAKGEINLFKEKKEDNFIFSNGTRIFLQCKKLLPLITNQHRTSYAFNSNYKQQEHVNYTALSIGSVAARSKALV